MKRNVEFDSRPINEQRIVIAKDLLARLRAKTFTPVNAAYLRIASVPTKEKDARKALARAECGGCQIGGFFLCALDRHNKLGLADLFLERRGSGRLYADEPPLREYLSKWFTHSELTAVEKFFEGWDRDGQRFARLVPRPADRMKMIAQNIVQGNGRFSASRLIETARSRKRSNTNVN